jgi:2-polyprenyl-3-methyl-5-hydroxy-6-metoxy-1,4-benzoquinol methylase
MNTESSRMPPLRALLSMDLKDRSALRERLDDHSIDDRHIGATMRNLERINVLLSGIRKLCDQTIFTAASIDRAKAMTIADLGCGGGDLALWLARKFTRYRIDGRIIGIDHDPRVTALAKIRCKGKPSITIVQGDATDLANLPDPVDWIVSNHFLHHLDSVTVTRILKTAAARARGGMIMNDLVRSRRSLIEFNLLCRALMPAGHTAHDGIVSILRSFTALELSAFLTKAGLSSNAMITRSGIGHRAIIFRR